MGRSPRRRGLAAVAAKSGALLHQAERRAALLIERDNFAVEDCGFGFHEL